MPEIILKPGGRIERAVFPPGVTVRLEGPATSRPRRWWRRRTVLRDNVFGAAPPPPPPSQANPALTGHIEERPDAT